MKDKPYLLEIYHHRLKHIITIKDLVQELTREEIIKSFPFIEPVIKLLTFKSIRWTTEGRTVSIKKRRD